MSVEITLNGRPHEITADTNVADLVLRLGLRSGMVAVEVNKELVTRDRRAETKLAAGDEVEVVTMVGGG